MDKSQAIRMFGSAAALGRAVGLSRSRISQWPEQLEQRQQDLVVGAAVRLGKLTLPSAPQSQNPRPSPASQPEQQPTRRAPHQRDDTTTVAPMSGATATADTASAGCAAGGRKTAADLDCEAA